MTLTATYLFRRLAVALVVLILASFFSFWVTARINPIYPLLFAQPRPTERINEITRRAHLDESISRRYLLWASGIVRGGDAGRTVLTNQPVWPPVWAGLRHTVELAAGAMLVVTLTSVLVGTMAARQAGSLLDIGLRSTGYVAWSIPTFLVALGLQELLRRLSLATGWQPLATGGWPSGSGAHYPLEWLRHLVLPIVTVSLAYIGAHLRYVRSSMLATLQAPYTVVARAKGARETRVVLHHALRNALGPFVAVLALDFGSMLGATMVADAIFGLGGLGSLYVQELNVPDPFLLQAILIVTVAIVTAFSLLSDAVLCWLDPRIRLG